MHAGSLAAALAGWLTARRAGGEWHLRIEDLDPPRVQPGAVAQIRATLEAHGLTWDGPVVYQSRRQDAYRAAADDLLQRRLAYHCDCSRARLRATGRPGPAGPVYPGTCRSRGLPAGPAPVALRMRTADEIIGFDDAWQGPYRCRLETDLGDFVLRRRDGPYAYVLAAVVDDAATGITHVVRGVDILPFTPAQIWLQRHLGLPTPAYAHHPVILAPDGQKLSKQTGATGLDDRRAGQNLHAALGFLGQSPPAALAGAGCPELLAWALSHWNPATLPPAAGRSFTVNEMK